MSIIVKQLNNVTEVPTEAISYGSNGQATVTEVVNGAHVVKDVTVGPAENGETQITSGVTAGDKVLEREIEIHRTEWRWWRSLRRHRHRRLSGRRSAASRWWRRLPRGRRRSGFFGGAGNSGGGSDH